MKKRFRDVTTMEEIVVLCGKWSFDAEDEREQYLFDIIKNAKRNSEFTGMRERKDRNENYEHYYLR